MIESYYDVQKMLECTREYFARQGKQLETDIEDLLSTCVPHGKNTSLMPDARGLVRPIDSFSSLTIISLLAAMLLEGNFRAVLIEGHSILVWARNHPLADCATKNKSLWLKLHHLGGYLSRLLWVQKFV